jgi:GNAT superfamily N-acetyltransferase
MTRSVSSSKANRWTDLVIDSDRRYFAAGAIVHRVPGGRLAVMPQLATLSAGAVVLVDDVGVILTNATAWRDEMLSICATAGASELRFYTPADDARLERALASTGMSMHVEIAMVGSVAELVETDSARGTRWRFSEVTTPALWRSKERLHARTPERPDGKAADAESWVKLERAKVVAGYMSPYLIEQGGEACGAFGLSFVPELLRFKNFFVDPAHRRCGAASAALRWMAREALVRGIDVVGCLVLPESVGRHLYARIGFAEVGRQLEWRLPIVERNPVEGRVSRNAVA